MVESTEKRITNFTKVFFTKGCAKPGVTEFEEAQDQEQKPIDMFPFLIQPDSFTQTVENGGWWWVVVGQGLWSWHAHEWRQCGPRNATPRRASLICSSSHLSPHSTPVFDLSFFIKKGNASLELDENGMPTIRAVRRYMHATRKAKAHPNANPPTNTDLDLTPHRTAPSRTTPHHATTPHHHTSNLAPPMTTREGRCHLASW